MVVSDNQIRILLSVYGEEKLKSLAKQGNITSTEIKRIGQETKVVSSTLRESSESATGFEYSLSGLNRSIMKTKFSLKAFRMEFLGLMFFGMFMQRTLQRIIMQSIKAYTEIAKGSTEASRGMAVLGAQFKYLQFAIGEAIAEAIMPLLPYIIAIVDKIVDWIEQNPNLVAGVLLIGTVLFGLMFVIGTVVLGLSSITMALITIGGGSLLGGLVTLGTFFIALGTSLWGISVILEGIKNEDFSEIIAGATLLGTAISIILLKLLGIGFVSILVAALWGVAIALFIKNIEWIGKSMVQIFSWAVGSVLGLFEWLRESILALFTGKAGPNLVETIAKNVVGIGDVVSGIVGSDIWAAKGEEIPFLKGLGDITGIDTIGKLFDNITKINNAADDLNSKEIITSDQNQKLETAANSAKSFMDYAKDMASEEQLAQLEKLHGSWDNLETSTKNVNTQMVDYNTYMGKVAETEEKWNMTITKIDEATKALDSIPKEVTTYHYIRTVGGFGGLLGSGFQFGGYVPAEGMYHLHGGEYVVNPWGNVHIAGMNINVNARTNASADEIANLVSNKFRDEVERYRS